MYTMNPKYLINVEAVDEQHQTLFGLIDKAQRLLKDENILYKYDDLISILNGLKDYTKMHFESEIKLMENIQYPDLAIHKAAHDSFVEKIRTYELDIDKVSLGTQDTVINDILSYLLDWLQVHILDFDCKVGIYMNENK